MKGRIQAKDVSTADFLKAIIVCGVARNSWCATRWDAAAVLAGYPEHIGQAPVTYAGMPEKVVLAKARSLIKGGLINGCACGCRGEFELAPEVAAELGLVRSDRFSPWVPPKLLTSSISAAG